MRVIEVFGQRMSPRDASLPVWRCRYRTADGRAHRLLRTTRELQEEIRDGNIVITSMQYDAKKTLQLLLDLNTYEL